MTEDSPPIRAPRSAIGVAPRAFGERLSKGWGLRCLLVLSGVAATCAGIFLIRHVSPDRYVLRMVLPEVEYRRELAELLADHLARQGVELKFVSLDGGSSAISAVQTGRADLCFSANEPQSPPEVGEVVQLSTEVLHILVRPELAAAGIEGLKRRTISLGQPGTDSRRLAEHVLSFAGLEPGRDFDTLQGWPDRQFSVLSSQFSVDRGQTETEISELRTENSAVADRQPDAVLLLSTPQSSEARRLVAKHGYVPLGVPFTEALARNYPALSVAELPPYLYAVAPPVPAEGVPCVATEMRLVAHQGVSVRAIRKVLDAVLDGAFARRGNLPRLGPEQLGKSSAFTLHRGTVHYLHRGDPLITPDLIMETEDLRNLVGSLVIGGILFWQWWQRRRETAIELAADQVNQLEHEALSLEMESELNAPRVNRIRRELARIKADNIQQFHRTGRARERHVADLLRRIDDLRHYLLGLLAHHHQVGRHGGQIADCESRITNGVLSSQSSAGRRKLRTPN